MLRFWLFSLFVCSIFYLIPALFVGLIVIAVVLCGSMTLYRKKVMLNRESVIAILLNCIVDVVTYVGRFLRKIRLISEVEALRFPNYLALLLKPHPDVKYEKIQIRDDTINIIIYYPKLRKNNGAIVYVHGGGWVMFTARMFHSPVSWIAHECQMITVSVDYSRPPEHPFPKALQDVYYALLWTQVNAAKLGIDPKKVVLMGDSCGANLSAAATRLHLDRLGKSSQGHSLPPVAVQVLVYPVLQAFNFDHGSFKSKGVTKLQNYCSYYISGDLSTAQKAGNPENFSGFPEYWKTIVDENAAGDLEVLRNLEKSDDNYRNIYCFPLLDPDPTDLPPTYVMALSRDTIRDDAWFYYKWLKSRDVPVTYVEESNADHGFMFLYGTDQCALDHLKAIAKFVWEAIDSI